MRIAAVVMMLVIASASLTEAQEGPQPILNAQFSFSNPGARSLGLGGAFVAVADDATAAWANPAGLVQITRAEVSAEGRYWSYSTPFVAGGRVQGEPSGMGLDTVSGFRTGTSDFDTSDLAFLSFVYPVGRWSLATYRHTFANLEAEAATEGLFAGSSSCCPLRFLDQRNRSSSDIVSYGVSAAFRMLDSFSIGLGVIYYDTTFEIVTDLYFWDDLEDHAGSRSTYQPERFVIGQSLVGEGWSIGLSGGFLWRISEVWSLGGRYREGPSPEVSAEVRFGGALDLGVPPGTVIPLDVVETADLPDSFGLGVAYRSRNGHLTLSFEWDRVTYSDPLESLEVDDQQLDDVDELHLGGEWVLLDTHPLVALRAGLWHDPDHATRANESANVFTRALLQPGEDELHFAVGLGLGFERWQLDAAVDVSDPVTTVSLSAIYSF